MQLKARKGRLLTEKGNDAKLMCHHGGRKELV
jgi:hypothetical protein